MSGEQASVLRPQHVAGRTLAELAETFGLQSSADLSSLATGVAVAASEVNRGDVFVGMRGTHAHGAQFAAEARHRGAVAILTDPEGAAIAANSELPVLVTATPRALLGEFSACVYRTAPPGLTLFGVTGTNGKTSTAYLIEAVLRRVGRRTGLSTTAERVIAGRAVPSRLTTPEANDVHAMIALMREAQVDAAILEVSAQALVRHRVDGVRFDVVGFTNLSHDHLDDFGTMEAYCAAKSRLFAAERAKQGVVSLDSPWGVRFCQEAQVPVQTITSRPEVEADWRVEVVAQHPDLTNFVVHSPDGTHIATSIPLIGTHMAANAGLAIAMIAVSGISINHIADAVADAPLDVYLPGRAERVSGSTGPSVYVDFGHSADAYATTLAALRQFTPGRLMIICAANGNRDATKREHMGRVAAEGSDVVIVTDHHPRHEDPAAIRAALLAGARAAKGVAEVIEVAAPEDAIVAAVTLAREGDTILWAGPGHLDYRDVAGVKLPFHARDLARAALRNAGW